MSNTDYHARIRPTLSPFAQRLVAAYEAVPGALTYPGAMPEGLAAVLEVIAGESTWMADIYRAAAELRGGVQ